MPAIEGILNILSSTHNGLLKDTTGAKSPLRRALHLAVLLENKYHIYILTIIKTLHHAVTNCPQRRKSGDSSGKELSLC